MKYGFHLVNKKTKDWNYYKLIQSIFQYSIILEVFKINLYKNQLINGLFLQFQVKINSIFLILFPMFFSLFTLNQKHIISFRFKFF